MTPIFNEYITFLKSKTNELDFLKQGYYWQDNTIIKAFTSKGELIKVARLYYDDKLKLSIKFYDSDINDIESWEDTLKRNKAHIDEIEFESLELIKKSINNYKDRNLGILYSSGKDSCVLKNLVRKVNKDIPLLFNDTTLDCADTYKFIKKEDNIIKFKPTQGFYQWREQINFVPSRFSRGCCKLFKERAMMKSLDKKAEWLFFMGMRNLESLSRVNYGDIWKNNKWGKRKWDAVLPIRKWSDLDIWLYIFKENIPFNTKYKKGYNRVGCAIACPYYSKTTWALDEYWYPKSFNRWQNILKKDFRKNNKDLIMNCTEEEYLTCWNGGVYREEPTEEVISQFAERNDLTYDIAKNYFNHKCRICGKKIKDKEIIGLNMKLNGRDIDELYCKKCFLEKMDINEETYNEYIKTFKEQGCKLL